jgi:DnaJ homolog subfamily A member 2
MNKDYYSILEASIDDDISIIKKKFRKLSLKHHPDKNGGENSRFNDINEAYTILGNQDKKYSYDTFYKQHFKKRETDYNNSYKPVEIIKTKNTTIPILNLNLEISLEQAFEGYMAPIIIERNITTLENNETFKSIEKEKIYVTIPIGIDSNENIMIHNKGHIYENEQGDIKIDINVKNDTIFEREGIDLLLHHIITLKEALCGFSFNIKHLNGNTFKINNHPGNIINTNSKKIVKNMGIKRDKYTGNLIIIFKINFPNTLSTEQIEGLKQIL